MTTATLPAPVLAPAAPVPQAGAVASRRSGWPGALVGSRLTGLYLGVLAATSVVLAVVPAGMGDALLEFVSTDLHRLAQSPVLVLGTSAFWVDGWGQFALAAGAFALLWDLERRIGARRWLGVFAAGHVGATLLVAGAELFALATGVVTGDAAAALTHGVDVGFSYGWCALAGLAWAHVGRRRRALLGLVALGLLTGFVTGDGFTALGHLLALGIGVAVEAATTRREAARVSRAGAAA